ncbi:DNA primase [Lactococcus nasutitermitis]|uniref:DNA primase n=1 Tax=Lactococcus nasutitermitis TaxID=1652957 RepID=A0ABV9JBB4_9LACT|nr:DNA primase [Lactococcus nasutitermitis]
MAILSNEELVELKGKVNIADVISQYVTLSKNGKNYLGLCPFHGEKTPSFNVNAEKGFYHCFGCGKSGDVIEFLKDYKQVGFVDAVKELAEFAGVTLAVDEAREQRNNPNSALYEINNQAGRLYNILLMSTELGARARDYLEERGISTEIIKRFNIGLAPDEEDFIFKNLSQKFEEGVLANSGLFNFSNNRVFDAFKNRIMFPITNEYGHVIGFSGRKWQADDVSKAKYINTSATTIFDKSFELYNLDKAKPVISKSHEVYLMEGFMDVIAAYKAGVFNVVASMGTALTEKHVHRLKQIAKNFVLVYDGDSAGQNAIYKALNLIGEGQTQVAKVPEGLDPDEYAKTYSLESLAALMKNGRIQPIEFLIDFLRPENLSNLQVQLDFIEQMAGQIAKVPSLTAQDAFIRKLVEILPDFEYNQVENAVNLRRENVAGLENFSSEVENTLTENFPARSDLVPPVREDESFLTELSKNVPPDFLENVPEYAPRIVPAVPIKQPAIKLSRIERAEEQLLNRMIYHSAVLKRFEEDENFRFVHQRYQDLFEKIMIEAMTFGELEDSHLAGELEADERNLFYQIISLDLPDEVSSQELTDLTGTFAREMDVTKLSELIHQLETAQKSGNRERELELTVQIINQKKKLL